QSGMIRILHHLKVAFCGLSSTLPRSNPTREKNHRIKITGAFKLVAALLLWTAALSLSNARAGTVVLDGKFGTSGSLSGPNYDINSSLGRIVGNNLFHSFSQFNLSAGDVATFSGPANIQNILTRVTGGSASSIDGTIRSTINGANFFLINPSGIIMGPNA